MIDDKLGEKLKFYRELNNYTQLQMANELLVSKAAYNRYENGKRVPSEEMLKTLSWSLNVDIATFHKPEMDSREIGETLHLRLINLCLIFRKRKWEFTDTQNENIRKLIWEEYLRLEKQKKELMGILQPKSFKDVHSQFKYGLLEEEIDDIENRMKK